MTKIEALQKLKRYCTYQERCHSEVRTKLISLKVYGDMLEEVILKLVQDDYLNEERFARSYARGKHRIKKWGRNKIIRELKGKGISDYCIKQGLSEIDSKQYVESLKEVISKYSNARTGKYDKYKLRINTIQNAVNKGYEYQLTKDTVDQLISW